MFIVFLVFENFFSLLASDQKERTYWINRLRQAASTSVSSAAITWSQSTSQLPVKPNSVLIESPLLPPRRYTMSTQQPQRVSESENQFAQSNSSAGGDHFANAPNQALSMFNASCSARDRLANAVDTTSARSMSCDSQLLQIKANAFAVCSALDQCIQALQKPNSKSPSIIRDGRQNFGTTPLMVIPPSAQHQDISPRRSKEIKISPQQSSGSQQIPQKQILPKIDHDKAIEDKEKYRETGIGNVEPQRPIILQMLAELKLGMDLTRVSLPTFTLEKRSLLEMFADCMGHPDLFLKINDQNDPELRMRQVLIWYLTSIHSGRQGEISKKPYNPVIGETFHCCWDVPNENTRMTFTAEQVSHHPPVTAFYFECPSKNMTLHGSIWTKSQFLGMSIGAQMIGQITVNLLNRGEQYTMTLPSAYARSILYYPWVELGDRCTINCPQTGYTASVVFHTKGAYGGTLHRISGEVISPKSSTPSLKFSGEWNKRIDFYPQKSVDSFSLDVTQLPLKNKKVRPISLQAEWESRRLWQTVTQALKAGDIDAATAAKKAVMFFPT